MSISPTFYAKLFDDLTVFFALLGSAFIKASRKMLVKSTPCFLTGHHDFRVQEPTEKEKFSTSDDSCTSTTSTSSTTAAAATNAIVAFQTEEQEEFW